MRRFLLIFTVFCFPFLATSQIGIQENFEGGAPPDWDNNGGFSFDDNFSCEGQSARKTLSSFFISSAVITSNNVIGQSNGTDLTLNFDYKIINSQDGTAQPDGWGDFVVEYSLDGGTSWEEIGTVDDSNHVVSDVCETLTYTIPEEDLPAGSDFQLRWDATWSEGNWRFVLDNVSALQVLTDPPNCDAEMIVPSDDETGVSVFSEIQWEHATGVPSGYLLSIGTTPGGAEVLDQEDVGYILNYSLPNNGNFDFDTTYYVTILPYNSIGEASGCTEFSFTTEENPHEIIDCDEGAIQNSFCYTSGGVTEFSYFSDGDTPVNLIINEGEVEDGFDEFIVLDSDGETILNPDTPYGPDGDGDLSGMFFQSTGSVIYIQVDADGSFDCGSSDYTPIDYTVSCATCEFQEVTYTAVDDCDNNQYFVDVNIEDLGTAASLAIEDDQGNTITGITEAGVQQFGPYPLDVQVSFESINEDDPNCILPSETITNGCPPLNDSCENAFVATVNGDNYCEFLNFGTLAESSGSNTPVSCGGTPVQDVWYEFTASADTHTITILSEGVMPSQALYEDDCGSLTELFCSEEFDNFGDSASIVATDLTIGETYKVRVFSDTETNVEFDLCITSPQIGEDNTSCDIAAPFCSPFDAEGNPEPLIFPNGYFYLEEFTAEEGPDYGCLGSEPNPAWFYLQVGQSGDLEFQITQNTAYNVDGEAIGDGLDVDFIAYGPFDSTDDNCNDLTASNTVDCSYSADDVEDFTIPDAQEGDYYVVLITNFNQSPGYISLGQTNYGEEDAGGSNCDIVVNALAACPGDELELSSTSAVDDVFFYEWYEYNEDTEEFESIEGAFEQTYTVTETGEYQVIAYLDQSLQNTITEVFDVTFNPAVELDVPENMIICENETMNLNAEPNNLSDYEDVEYQWYLNDDELTGENESTLSISEGGDYTVDVTTYSDIPLSSSNQECIETFEFSVQSGAYQIDFGGDQEFCDVETAEITAEIIGADDTNASFLWSTGEETQSISVSESNIYTVTATIDGCEVTESVEYIFNESPIIDLGEDIVTCNLDGIILDATPENFDPENTLYEWTLGGEIIDGENLEDLDVSLYDFGTYEVTAYSDSEDCFSTSSVTITERDDIELNLEISPDRTQFCEGETIDFTANLTNATADEVDFVWLVDGVSEGDAQDFDYQFDGEEVTIEVEISINGACDYTASVDLTGYDDNQGCVITQGISPNGDGQNENLDLSFLDDRTGISSLEVFNRYGRSVYKQGNYRNEFFGQDEDGDELVTGTYFYVIKFEGDDPVFGREKKGWIYINKEN